MTRRSRDWNEQLARDLKDRDFSREFVLALIEEGATLQQALGKTIRAFGIKEFARRARLPSSNVSRAIGPGHNPSQKTLERLLKPLGLQLSAAPARKSKGSRAA